MRRQSLVKPIPSIPIAVAVGLGLLIAVLPVSITLLLVGGVIGLGILYYEPSLAIILTLSVAPLKTLIETEANFPFPVDIGQLAFAATVGIWGVRYLVDRRTDLYFPLPLSIGLLLFIVGSSLSLWTAYSATATVRETLKWIQVFILMVIVANERRWDWVLLGIVLSAAIQATIGIWEFLGGSGAPHLWILDFRYFRAFGTFGQPNPFGAFMGMILPLTLGISLGYIAHLWQIHGFRPPSLLPEHGITVIYLGLSGLILFGLLSSWSRGAWLGFLSALAVMLWSFPRRRWVGNVAIVGGAIVLLILGAVGVLPQSITARLTGFGQDFVGFRDVRGVVITDENFAVVERLAHWQAGIEMAESSPWLGVGFGNYEVAYPDFALINWRFALGHAHNYYLNLWAETGIIGLLSYLAMWAIIVLMTWRCLRPSFKLGWQARGIVVGLLGTWMHIAVHSLLDKLYVNNLFLHVGAMLGILAILTIQTQTDR